MMRSMRGEKLKVDIHMKDGMKAESYENWVPLNGATLRAMGYVPALGYKTGFRDMFTNVYIKFHGFEKYPCYREVDGELVDMAEYNTETASTMYDYFASPAQEEFIKSMRSRNMTTVDVKKVITLIIIACGVGIVAWMFLGGGK